MNPSWPERKIGPGIARGKTGDVKLAMGSWVVLSEIVSELLEKRLDADCQLKLLQMQRLLRGE